MVYSVIIFHLLIANLSTVGTPSRDRRGSGTHPGEQQQVPVANGQVLFYRSARQGSGNLFLMNTKGKGITQLGYSGSRPDHYPNWSPNGELITFESYRKGGWRVWIMNSDGTEARRVLQGRTGIRSYEFDPSFSSDGQKVYFASDGDIYTVAIDGSALENITNTPNEFEYSPYESPGGAKLVFVSEGQIFIMDLATKTRKKLSQGSATIDYAPTWSPDGRRILFYSDESGSFELYTMTSDGQDRSFLLNKTEMDKLDFRKQSFVDAWDNNWGATDQYKASFSPDGQYIAFSREVGGVRKIFISQSDGHNIRQITFGNSHDGFPVWRPVE